MWLMTFFSNFTTALDNGAQFLLLLIALRQRKKKMLILVKNIFTDFVGDNSDFFFIFCVRELKEFNFIALRKLFFSNFIAHSKPINVTLRSMTMCRTIRFCFCSLFLISRSKCVSHFASDMNSIWISSHTENLSSQQNNFELFLLTCEWQWSILNIHIFVCFIYFMTPTNEQKKLWTNVEQQQRQQQQKVRNAPYKSHAIVPLRNRFHWLDHKKSSLLLFHSVFLFAC